MFLPCILLACSLGRLYCVLWKVVHGRDRKGLTQVNDSDGTDDTKSNG